MSKDEKIFQEAFDVISDGREEIIEEKKVVYDNRTEQFSIKIPKKLALKKGLNKDTIFKIIFNPREERIQEIMESGFILFPKEVDDGEK